LFPFPLFSASDHYQVNPLEKETADLTDAQKAKVLGEKNGDWLVFALKKMPGPRFFTLGNR
jgi:hypothetical protein